MKQHGNVAIASQEMKYDMDWYGSFLSKIGKKSRARLTSCFCLAGQISVGSDQSIITKAKGVFQSMVNEWLQWLYMQLVKPSLWGVGKVTWNYAQCTMVVWRSREFYMSHLLTVSLFYGETPDIGWNLLSWDSLCRMISWTVGTYSWQKCFEFTCFALIFK